MNKIKNKIKLFLIIINLIFITGCFNFKSNTKNGNDSTLFFIHSGSSVNEIIDSLISNKILLETDKKIFRDLLIRNGIDRNIKWGHYYFYLPTNPESLISMINKSSIQNFVTIPEGLSIEQIANILQEKAGCDSSEFVNLCKDREFIKEILKNTSFDITEIYTLEGFLFPSSYNFGFGITPKEAIEKMIEQFNSIDFIVYNNLDKYKTLILASLIEKEAMFDNERSRISSVYINRIKKGMLLQCDATVLYALGYHKKTLLYKDLEIDSPYNTYKYYGFPPTPICNPGEKSIIAAINPEDSEYLYYVAKADGYHIFSKNYSDHINAVRSVRN